MLVFVIGFSYVVGNLKSFFDLDALFNEFILGYILPICMLIKEGKNKIKNYILCLFLVFVMSIHAWAISSRVKDHFIK